MVTWRRDVLQAHLTECERSDAQNVIVRSNDRIRPLRRSPPSPKEPRVGEVRDRCKAIRGEESHLRKCLRAMSYLTPGNPRIAACVEPL